MTTLAESMQVVKRLAADLRAATSSDRATSPIVRLSNFNASAGIFNGYASVFGNEDSDEDVIDAGAFTKSLAERSSLPLLWQHKPDEPIGVVRGSQDEYGLKVHGEFVPGSRRAQEAAAMIGVLGLSWGGRVITSERRGGRRHVTEAKVREVSIVTFPANPLALAKSANPGISAADVQRLIQTLRS